MTTTSSNNKRIAKNTLLLYVRMLFTMAISLYTSRVVLDVLGAVDYGIYNVVGGFVVMFSVISGAMSTATQRFLSFEIGKGEGGDVGRLFSTSVVIHIALAAIILLLAETVGLWFVNAQMNFPAERYVAANWVYQLSLFTFLVNVVSVPYMAAIIAYERMKTFAYVSVVEVTLKLVVVLLLVVSPCDKLVFYAAGLTALAVAIRLVYGAYCRRQLRECRFSFVWDSRQGRGMMSFVGWNMIGSLAGVGKEQGVNVLLNLFFGAAVNAARGVAYQVSAAMTGFVSNFQLAMNPQIVKMYAAGEREDMFKLVFRGSKYSFLLMLCLSLPVMIEAPFVLGVWLKDVPEHTVVFVRLVLLTALIDAFSGTLIATMHASGKVRDYQIVVGGLSLLSLPAAYVLLKFGFPPASAMAAVLAVAFLCHFARLALLGRSVDFPVGLFLHKVTLRCMGIALLSAVVPVAAYASMDSVTWYSFVVVVVLSLVSTATFAYSIGLSRNERAFVVGKLRSLKRKLLMLRQ